MCGDGGFRGKLNLWQNLKNLEWILQKLFFYTDLGQMPFIVDILYKLQYTNNQRKRDRQSLVKIRFSNFTHLLVKLPYIHFFTHHKCKSLEMENNQIFPWENNQLNCSKWIHCQNYVNLLNVVESSIRQSLDRTVYLTQHRKPPRFKG